MSTYSILSTVLGTGDKAVNKAKVVLTSCPLEAYIPIERDTQHGNYELMQGKNIECNSGRKRGSGGFDRMVREVLSKEVTLVIPLSSDLYSF